MPLCISTGLTIKNTFLDGEPDDCAAAYSRGSQSCIARFAEALPDFIVKDFVESITNANTTPNLTDTEDDESDAWEEGDNTANVVINDYTQTGAFVDFTLTAHSFDALSAYSDAGTDIFGSHALALPAMQPVTQPLQVCLDTCVPAVSLPSKGSQYHGTTTLDGLPACQPCAWYYKAAGCKNGAECPYCHSCPPHEMKNRKKDKIARIRGQY
jgi:hypothetical protein